jgi:KaiC/GvpD/RAD55 family RecA-like ATPase
MNKQKNKEKTIKKEVLFDSIYEAIDSVLTTSRIILQQKAEGNTEILMEDDFILISREILLEKQSSKHINALKAISVLNEEGETSYKIRKDFLFPFNKIIKDYKRNTNEANLKYYIKKSIRNYYKCVLSFKLIEAFSNISSLVNDSLKNNNETHIDTGKLYEMLGKQREFVGCYLETSILAGYVCWECEKLFFSTTFFDTEYLISHLFGMPTNIPGFDTLFGEGGIILQDSYDKKEGITPPRTILISGESGCGKTTLGLQLASEVAQKGGLAWYMPLEQSIDECLYTLKSFQSKDVHEYFIGTDRFQAKNILDTIDKNIEDSGFDYGALIFLHPQKDDLDTLFATLLANAPSFHEKKLNLFVIDPINSVKQNKTDENNVDVRNRTVDFIKKLESFNKNLVIIAENYRGLEKKSNRNTFIFLENICDTHIELTIRKEYNYAQRYFEIKKSRMQREQRGEHAYSISSGKGIHVFPSSASIAARVRKRLILKPPARSSSEGTKEQGSNIKFGYSFIDDKILNNSLHENDVIVFKGPSGSFKSLLGACFLLTKNDDNAGNLKSLWFDVEQVNQNRKDELIGDAINITKGYSILNEGDVKLITLPRGCINPGYVLQEIENAIQKVHLNGKRINRIMINGITQWQFSSPFIANDNIFAVALVELLKSYGVPCLILTGTYSDENKIQESILDNANCVFEFERFDFRGLPRVTMRVIHSSGMRHDRSLYEVQKINNKILIESRTSLLRFISKDGIVNPVNIRLFFHSDSKIQRDYYNSVSEAIKAVLSPNVNIDIQDRLYFYKVFQSSQFSAMDELQLLQIDEFQLGMHNEEVNTSNALYNINKEQFADFLIDSNNSQELISGSSICAVPFFENVSFLVYKSGVEAVQLQSWESIVELVGESKIFDFAGVNTESLNCFYLEILFSVSSKNKNILTDPDNSNHCTLLKLINSEEGVKAAYYFRKLCKSSVNLEKILANIDNFRKAEPTEGENHAGCQSQIVSSETKIWRHWYTTFNQMRIEDNSLINQLEIAPLPDNISVSGKWYLGMPNYSAAPDVGIELIKQLTSKDAELGRVRKGVGLPVRESYYNKLDESLSLSPYYSLTGALVKKMIANAFKRSTFKCYHKVSSGLSSVLIGIINIDNENNENVINEKIRKFIKKFTLEFEYIMDEKIIPENGRLNFNCSFCGDCKEKFTAYMKTIIEQ